MVVPTRELAIQVAADLATASKRIDVRIATVYGGRAYEPQISALRKGVDIVVGNVATGEAVEALIKAGFCDAAVVGGVDIASVMVLAGFRALEAVSPGLANPFSRNRDGITLGDGAAFFVITREDLWKTGIQLLGWGESSDASHMTAPEESGAGAAAAIRKALASAGLEPEDIDYINLHGTGTRLNDLMESRAVSEIFGPEMPPVSSTKPVTGHTLGAAGALELAICCSVLETGDGRLPVHSWDGEKDDDLPALNFVRKEKTYSCIRTCMSNTFGFGGCNVSLIVGERHDAD